MNVAQFVSDGLLIVAAVEAAAAPVYYQWCTRGSWRYSETGWHLMAFMLSFAAVLVLSVLRIAVGARLDVAWFQVLRLGVFATVPVVYGWRLRVMWLAQREGRP